MAEHKRRGPPRGPGLGALLKPYRRWMLLLIALTMGSSGLGLFVPQVVAKAIDAFTAGKLDLTAALVELTALTLGTFFLGNVQSVVQTIAAERVARDLRTRLADAIARQNYAGVERMTPAKLLTNLTSDVDSIKTFVAQAVAALISSAFVIVAASALLVYLNWRLALVVLTILPLIGLTFFLVMRRVRKLFGQVQGTVDRLNRVLNENIVGAALVRLLDTGGREFERFVAVNEESRGIGMLILRQFAAMMPAIAFLANLAALAILVLGGHYVIVGQMSLGEFSAFNAYLVILIYPIFVIGFTSMMIGQAQASFARISVVLHAPLPPPGGELLTPLSGRIDVRELTLSYGEHKVLDRVSLTIAPGTRTAIVGPTAAGKSQLFYLLTGLLEPTSGEIAYDGHPLQDYRRDQFCAQIGFVFQDSKLFNLTLRENIAFNTAADDDRLLKAIATAELHDFIAGLPNGLDTIVSERGTSLSGGQKQRIMLARALAIEPRILFLDDFTARVDIVTEARILANVRRNYPGLALISITQKIAAVEDFDQIILLMEGEVLARGTHAELLQSSPEYVQILRSQESTDRYEAA